MKFAAILATLLAAHAAAKRDYNDAHPESATAAPKAGNERGRNKMPAATVARQLAPGARAARPLAKEKKKAPLFFTAVDLCEKSQHAPTYTYILNGVAIGLGPSGYYLAYDSNGCLLEYDTLGIPRLLNSTGQDYPHECYDVHGRPGECQQEFLAAGRNTAIPADAVFESRVNFYDRNGTQPVLMEQASGWPQLYNAITGMPVKRTAGGWVRTYNGEGVEVDIRPT